MDIAIGADQRRDFDPLSPDIPQKIAEDRERGDSAETILRLVLSQRRDKTGSGRSGGQGNDMAPGRQTDSPGPPEATADGAKAA
jgi:hypothetical protein